MGKDPGRGQYTRVLRKHMIWPWETDSSRREEYYVTYMSGTNRTAIELHLGEETRP